MLFVYDDEAQAIERSEHGRSRPDHNIDFATPDAMPLVVTFAVGQRAVLDRDAVAEGAAEHRRHRRCQRDLRHHQEHPASCRADAIREPQIYLRFAAAGDPVQKRDAEVTPVGERGELLEREALLVG